jgi:hypothetical protein
MDEYLTMEEIKARYAPNWVLIVDYKSDEFQRVLGGRVVFASPDRDEVYDKALELPPGDVAYRYLGEWPTDMELMINW